MAGANNIQPQPGQIDAGGPATGRATQKRKQETEHKKKKEKGGKKEKKREHKKKKKGDRKKHEEPNTTKTTKEQKKGRKKKKKEKKQTNTSTRKRKDQRPCPASNSQQTLAADHAKDWTKNAGFRVMKMFLTVHKCILFGKRRMTK